MSQAGLEERTVAVKMISNYHKKPHNTAIGLGAITFSSKLSPTTI